jgi:hypothetical protein
MTERRAAAAKRAAAASECAATATAQPADPPLRMELLHAARYLPPGTIPHIEIQLIRAFSQLLPAFDAVVQRSERENGQNVSKMWSLLGIDTDFRLDSEQDGGIVPLVLEANVSYSLQPVHSAWTSAFTFCCAFSFRHATALRCG